MEDVLTVYELPYNADRPVVCMDEKPVQLLGEAREPIPISISNHTPKYDSEYVRQGTCSIFMFTEPLGGWREAHVREHRTRKDWAAEIKWLVDDVYPEASKILLVMDNLNTHTTASLYETFPPAEAHRLARKLEIHYTPKHGSWLDIAECELSVMTRQCLEGRRISDINVLRNELRTWSRERNSKQKSVDWQFTTQDARIKLKRLYPVPEFNN